jgi:hypothetical protein
MNLNTRSQAKKLQRRNNIEIIESDAYRVVGCGCNPQLLLAPGHSRVVDSLNNVANCKDFKLSSKLPVLPLQKKLMKFPADSVTFVIKRVKHVQIVPMWLLILTFWYR